MPFTDVTSEHFVAEGCVEDFLEPCNAYEKHSSGFGEYNGTVPIKATQDSPNWLHGREKRLLIFRKMRPRLNYIVQRIFYAIVVRK